jgi:NAD(P)-dependent dehydrogenase (short-subunit alcohol dehydrogenase family)
MEIQDKIAIITGASSGIGAATARELAHRGAAVVLAARRAEQIDALTSEIEQQGGRALAVPTDVRQRAEIDRLVQATLDTFGRIDILINNAGIGAGKPLLSVDDATLQQVVDVNLLAPARCVQAVAPHMRKQGSGVIVNIGSVAGELGTLGPYSATKFGLRGLNDTLRRELRNDNIDVILIAPGFIRTSMTEGIKRVPMPGPEVVARTVAQAIQRPRRKIFVPRYYALFAYIAKLMPRLTDWLIGSAAYRRFRGRSSET